MKFNKKKWINAYLSNKVFAFILESILNCGLDSLSEGLASGNAIQISLSGVFDELLLLMLKLVPLVLFKLLLLFEFWLLLLRFELLRLFIPVLLILPIIELFNVDVDNEVTEARSFGVGLYEFLRFKKQYTYFKIKIKGVYLLF